MQASSIPCIEICSVSQLTEKLVEIQNAHVASSGVANIFWFRGESNCTRSLLPSAFRREEILESVYSTRFRLQAPFFLENTPPADNHGAWLPIMQHYGLPTRLLDWTESPLIALFFAVAGKNVENDAVLYIFDSSKWNEIAHKFSAYEVLETTKNKHIQKMCRHAFCQPQYRDKEIRYSPLAVESGYSSKRMFAQLGKFTLHDNATPMNEIGRIEEVLTKFIIPKDKKVAIYCELQTLGIKKIQLFPEIETLISDLKEIVKV